MCIGIHEVYDIYPNILRRRHTVKIKRSITMLLIQHSKLHHALFL